MTMDFSAGNVLEHVELNNMILAVKGDGVTNGMAVSERGAGANMSVEVSAGNCYISGTSYAEGVRNRVIEASHATLYRKDLITYDPTTSQPVVTKGTNHAGGTSDPIYPPDIPAGDILLAIVDVDAAVTTIVNADTHDARMIVVAAAVPSGMIAIWTGTVATIPDGWAICDGANGTPNLLDKFVKGTSTSVETPGSEGGETTHDHTISPADGEHDHTLSGPSDTAGFTSGAVTAADYDHIHTTSTDGAHTHTIQYGDNLPPYYEVAYIMKT